MTSTLTTTWQTATLSPYFNHELLGAVINAIATSSILKVAQGAYGTPGAVAVAQLFPRLTVAEVGLVEAGVSETKIGFW